MDCAKYEHKTERGLLLDLYSWLPKSCGEAGERSETEEDCCLIFRKSFFNKDNINYKTSTLYRHSAVASCHFPRLLGKARGYVYVYKKAPPLGKSKYFLSC